LYSVGGLATEDDQTYQIGTIQMDGQGDRTTITPDAPGSRATTTEKTQSTSAW